MDLAQLYAITLGLVSVLLATIGVLIYFIKRMVKDFDDRFSKLFERTDAIEGMKTDIAWMKEQHNKNHG